MHKVCKYQCQEINSMYRTPETALRWNEGAKAYHLKNKKPQDGDANLNKLPRSPVEDLFAKRTGTTFDSSYPNFMGMWNKKRKKWVFSDMACSNFNRLLTLGQV